MVVANKTQETVSDQARRLLGRLAFEMNRVSKSSEVERIHDLRVAIRRFSQLLGVFQALFTNKDLRKLRRRLKKLLAAAGQVRNCDIALKLISKSPAADSDLLRSKLKTQRKEYERNLLNALATCHENKTSFKWRSAMETAIITAQPALDPHRIEEIEGEMLSRMTKNFFARGHRAAAAKNPRQLHEFRITAKKFRYTLELFEPYCPAVSRLAESLKGTQRLLGDINDCETTREILANFRPQEDLDAWLMSRQRKRIVEFRRHWTTQFGDRQAELSWIERLNRFRAPARKPVGRGASPTGPKLRRAAVA